MIPMLNRIFFARMKSFHHCESHFAYSKTTIYYVRISNALSLVLRFIQYGLQSETYVDSKGRNTFVKHAHSEPYSGCLTLTVWSGFTYWSVTLNVLGDIRVGMDRAVQAAWG
jgi:hypothetical protein